MADRKVLVVGSGGREHAIVDALSRSPQVAKIYCAPGNAGIGLQAENVPLKDTDVEGLKAFALANGIDLTVVGPESALAAGLVDAFREAGLAVFGHTRAATRIESSKEFAKELMFKYGIPTAGYRAFSSYDEALAYEEKKAKFLHKMTERMAAPVELLCQSTETICRDYPNLSKTDMLTLQSDIMQGSETITELLDRLIKDPAGS